MSITPVAVPEESISPQRGEATTHLSRPVDSLLQSYLHTLRDIFSDVDFWLIFPFEGSCVFVVKFDVVEDFCFQFIDGAEISTSQNPSGQTAEPTFDLVQPRAMFRRTAFFVWGKTNSVTLVCQKRLATPADFLPGVPVRPNTFSAISARRFCPSRQGRS